MSDITNHPSLRASERLLTEVQRLVWAQGLSDDSLNAILATADYVEFNSGDRVIALDSEVSHIYFVIRGGVRVILYDPLGKEVLRHSMSRGNMVGLFAVALEDRSTLQAEATESTATLRLTLDQLLLLTSQHADFHRAILRLAASITKHAIMLDRTRPKPPVVGLVHHSDASRPLGGLLASRLSALDEHVCMAGDDERWKSAADVPFRLLVERGQLIDATTRQQILKEWAAHGRLLIDVSVSLGLEHLADIVGFSDIVLWCVREQDAPSAIETLRTLENRVSSWRDRIRIVWILAGDACVSPYTPDLAQFAARDFKLTFDPPTEKTGPLLHNGIERIIHHLRGIQIGLALGGGAARGMAHLGVLQSLEENGIVVDMLAGTSAGAMTGTVYSAGFAPRYATQCFKNDLLPGWIFRQLPASGYWYLLYKYRLNRFEPMLRKYLGDAQMEQLLVPMAAISVDLVDGISLVRDSGDATINILESINLPPLSLPRFAAGQAVVDGGLLNNVPADVLLTKGCNFVIASTVTAKLEKDFMAIRSQGRARLSRFSSTIQVIMRQNLIQSHNMNSVGIQPADFVIAPDVTKFDPSEFTRADEMAVIGHRATQESMTQLRSMLAKLDSKLFASPFQDNAK